MTQLETALAYLEAHEAEMLQLWETIVRMESPSADAEAVSRLASHLDTYCTGLGMTTEQYGAEKAGKALAACTPARELPPVALLGHIDTVHPVGCFEKGPWTVEDGQVYGPGVHDCKGGLAISLMVIRALEHAGYDKRQIRLLLASDEEAAHTLSKQKVVTFLQKYAKDCCATFTFESGLPHGGVITRRKGGGIMKLTVEGIASHAGNAPEKGASAIWEAARKIVAIQSWSDPNHVTYNCGIIHGGTSANVVPDHCEVSVAIRFITNQDRDDAIARLQALCATVETPGTHCSLGPIVGYPAMEEVTKTGALFDIYKAESEKLGLGSPEPVFSAGCSDSSYTTALGIPTLCAVGVLGEGQHTLNEHARMDTMLTQAKRMAAAILALPDDF